MKNYEVKIIMEEKYIIRSENEEDAIVKAQDRFKREFECGYIESECATIGELEEE